MKRLIILLIVLIGYGSFFPFAYVPHSPSWSDAAQLAWWPSRVGFGDAVGNVLLFTPLGLALGARARNIGFFLLAFIAVSVFAALIQYVQFWFPSRVPSLSDIVFNAVGGALGLALGAAAFAAGDDAAERGQAASRARMWVPLTLILLWVIYRWFPLVPTLDWQNVKNALKPLLIDRTWSITRTAHDAVAWLMWFRLCRYAFRDWGNTALWVGLSFMIVAAEPFFVRNTVSLNNVMGVVIAALIAPFVARGKSSLGWLIGGSGLVLLAWIALPFDFGLPPAPFAWVPMSGFLTGDLATNTAALIEKVFLFGAWVYLALYRGAPAVVVALAVFCGLFAAEWVQKWSPDRSPEITDSLIGVIAVAILSPMLSGNFTKRERRKENSHQKQSVTV